MRRMTDQRRLNEDVLRHWFSHHAPRTPGIQLAHEAVRRSCLDLGLVLNDLVPESAEKTLALRSLQQTMNWANTAIALRQELPQTAVAVLGSAAGDAIPRPQPPATTDEAQPTPDPSAGAPSGQPIS